MFEDLKPHLADLQKRLIIISITLGVMFFVCFAYYEPILKWMLAPIEAVLPVGSKMIAVEVSETFFTAVKVSLFGAFLISLPIIFWQIWLFLAPGLYSNEKKIIVPFVLGATIMFLMGAIFSYYIVVPFGFDFLVNFGSQVVAVTPSIGAYITFFIKIVFGFGIAFELPVITFFFAVIGIVNDKMMKDFFKYAVVFIFILAALLTPPDVVTQFLMAIPLILLYIVSIYIAKIFNPAGKEEIYEDDEEE
ncbi:MAG: twin-arginine translocase subunit TatC [Arcobacteraceae bacterium]|jgi:sec-independent protein translocase protein TatC|nr:twin-arginine translocase subunit TatC [Arcobacteraceae bacterium]